MTLINELTPLPKPYEPYPGCSLQNFACEFLTGKPITIEAFCKNERVDPRVLPRLVREILVEWELTEPPHFTRREAMNHLVNHLRIKIRNERNNPYRTTCGEQSSGRSQHRNPTAFDVAREILGNAAR